MLPQRKHNFNSLYTKASPLYIVLIVLSTFHYSTGMIGIATIFINWYNKVMLINSSKIIGTPVMSLHVSGKIAETTRPIIDPHNLKIVAFYLAGPMVGRDEVGDILDVKYIREFSNLGMIVNSYDDFITREDAVRLKKLLEYDYSPIGKRVVTKKGSKLGKVIDYTLDPADFQIRQLIVQRPALKAIMDPELVVSVNQVVKIDDNEIIVKDEEQKIRAQAIKEEFVPNLGKPFREHSFAPAQNQNPDELDTE